MNCKTWARRNIPQLLADVILSNRQYNITTTKRTNEATNLFVPARPTHSSSPTLQEISFPSCLTSESYYCWPKVGLRYFRKNAAPIVVFSSASSQVKTLNYELEIVTCWTISQPTEIQASFQFIQVHEWLCGRGEPLLCAGQVRVVGKTHRVFDQGIDEEQPACFPLQTENRTWLTIAWWTSWENQ